MIGTTHVDCVLLLFVSQLNKSYHAAADVHQATFTKSAIVGCRNRRNVNIQVRARHAYFNSLDKCPSINSVHHLFCCLPHLLHLVPSFCSHHKTLLWVQLQLHCWAAAHTQTGSQMTACGCRRSCCRERASSRGPPHWRTSPPEGGQETLVMFCVEIRVKMWLVWKWI